MYKADYKAILLSVDLAREQYEGLTTHDSIYNSVNTQKKYTMGCTHVCLACFFLK